MFQAARLVGPALASVLIVCAGTGWVFAANAACYLGPTVGLLLLRPADLQPSAAPAASAARSPRAAREAAAYVRRRPEIRWTIFLVGMLGTFGLNFPIVLTAMAKSAYGGDASTYGLFNIVLGLGSAAGAVLAGAGARPRTRAIVSCAALFGVLQVAGALAPGIAVFAVLLAAMGLVNLICQAMANSAVQLAVDPEIRGRVMGLYMLAFIGGTPIGALTVGEITSHYGARAGMAFCGAVPAVAAVVVAIVLAAQGTRGRRRQGSQDNPESPHLRTIPTPPERVISWSPGPVFSRVLVTPQANVHDCREGRRTERCRKRLCSRCGAGIRIASAPTPSSESSGPERWGRCFSPARRPAAWWR